MMRDNVYDKLRKLRVLVSKNVGVIEEQSLFRISSKLSTWHYPKKRTKDMKLNKDEAMIYELYILHGYNPSTVYKWMLACNTNNDIQNQLKEGSISLKNAMKNSRKFKRLSQAEEELSHQIKLCINKYVIR